jgi:hypothetical protein
MIWSSEEQRISWSAKQPDKEKWHMDLEKTKERIK